MATNPAQQELAEPVNQSDPEFDLPDNFGEGLAGRVVFWIAICFSTYQVTTSFGIPLDRPFFFGLTIVMVVWALFFGWAAKIAYDWFTSRGNVETTIAFFMLLGTFGLLIGYAGGAPSVTVRAVHVGFLCLLAGGMLAVHRSPTTAHKMLWWGLGIAAFLVGIYQWHEYNDLVIRDGNLTHTDLVIGVISLITLFAIVWRTMGMALPIISGLSLAYIAWGQFLPRGWNHRGFAFEDIIEHISFGTEGIYGTPAYVSATYIFLFVLFGAFMERAGVINFFNELSMALFGGRRGGPAKVCIASSALMGTVAGSGVANVVASGQFTIPLMKRFGFTSAFAGGVEATSSMGGVMTPPVMGAVAFIMAETLGVPFIEIMKAAIIPACLYFAACYWAVHLEAGKHGLHGIPRSELPSAWGEIRKSWFLVLPLIALIVLLFGGFTPLYAGSVGLALTVVMILATAIALGIGTVALRVFFWIALGLLCAFSLYWSVPLIIGIILLLVLANMFWAGGRETLIGARNAFGEGARLALSVGLACAIVGIMVGVMTKTGIGTIIGNAVIGVGKDNLLLALIMSMIFNLILGIGLPTIPNYIITASLTGPILLELGVPLIVSHMFVFYYGIMADLTPPVALAAYAAAPMAKESGMKIGWEAMRIALPGFLWPFVGVYNPALMLQPVAGYDGTAYWLLVAYVVFKSIVTILLWGAFAIGYWHRKLNWWERTAAMFAGFLLIGSDARIDSLASPLFWMAGIPFDKVTAVGWWDIRLDILGFALTAALYAFHYWRTRDLPETVRAV